MQVQFAVGNIDGNLISVFHDGKWAAFGRFRRNVPHKTTVIGAGKAAVGYQGSRQRQTSAI